MTVIIDGYNLLHASGVFGADRGPRGFEQSRIALLDVLLDLLGDEAGKTIVVFDAANAPTACRGGAPMGRCGSGTPATIPMPTRSSRRSWKTTPRPTISSWYRAIGGSRWRPAAAARRQ